MISTKWLRLRPDERNTRAIQILNHGMLGNRVPRRPWLKSCKIADAPIKCRSTLFAFLVNAKVIINETAPVGLVGAFTEYQHFP